MFDNFQKNTDIIFFDIGFVIAVKRWPILYLDVNF